MLLLWVFGLGFSPLLFASLFSGKLEPAIFSILGLVVFALGTLGIFGVLQLLKLLLFQNVSVSPPNKLKVFLASGFAVNTVVICLFSFELTSKTLAASLPMIVTVHLIYLSRDYLWENS